MSDNNNLNKTDQASSVIIDSLKVVPTEQRSSLANLDGMDPLLFAYMEIYSALQVSHETAQINAKVLAVNADRQEELIGEEANIHFATLGWQNDDVNPKDPEEKIDPIEISKMGLHNQEVSAMLNELGNRITMERQKAQVTETELNTDINECQQAMQQGISLMQMLVSLTNQISRI